jgi:TfoX/Sxy family transcriptional regulator of competence genes
MRAVAPVINTCFRRGVSPFYYRAQRRRKAVNLYSNILRMNMPLHKKQQKPKKKKKRKEKKNVILKDNILS